MEFVGFQKIARLKREAVITEKLDGTNACVHIVDLPDSEVMPTDTPIVSVRGTGTDGAHTRLIYAGSRTRWITPQQDNYGFAGWVERNADELYKLGPGSHFGEWWGAGIQRRYGQSEKKFSLFNTARWTPETLPACCSVVPVLYQGVFSSNAVEDCLEKLRTQGSVAAPGFERPEGVVVYLAAARHLFKVTLENDGVPKGQVS